MRRFLFPQTFALLITMIVAAPTTFAQSTSRSVMEGAATTLTDQTAAPAVETAWPSEVYSEGTPVYSYDSGMPQAYQYVEAPAAAPAPAKPKGNPAKGAHKGLYYANDFSYLTDGYDGPRYLGDNWKNIGSEGRLSLGGEIRTRYHFEEGMGQQAGATRFQDTENEFGLLRLRLYANYKLSDRLRLYAEGIYADVSHSNDEYIPRGIDRNYGDLLNLFADVKISDSTNVRIGRQELLFGAQRLISPLDWANTRRTFEGVRTTSKFDDWSLDAFWTQPVQIVRNEFDRSNENVDFYGMYLSYTGWENSNLDLYYLGFNNDTNGGTFNIDTFGTRLYGSRGDWLYDVEGSIQTGAQQALGQSHEAYAITAGIGRKFKDVCWTPQLWFYYDYASGNDAGTPDTFERYNQLFPLAHKYLGFIDAVQRANIAAPNIQLTMNPTKKLKLLMWYHSFQAAEASDVVPGIGGTPAQDPNSTDFGHEIDLIASLNINPRNNVLVGYSHLWTGDKIINGQDADFFYVQLTKRF